MAKHSKKGASKRQSREKEASQPSSNLRVVFSERQIQKRIRELAEEVNRDYRGKSVHVVGILEQSFMFMADLLRELKVPVECHFLKVETRDRVQGGVPLRELMYTPKVVATGNHMLLLDGVLQSGVTQDHLYRYILGQEPASLRTVTLIEKTDERKVDLVTDYVGFKTSAKFLVGYGLGYEGKYRNLPYIASVS